MQKPLYAIHNRIKSSGIINEFILKAIDNYSSRKTVVRDNAFRILENTMTGKNLEDVDGLKKGMEILGCEDPEALIVKIEPEFEREIIAPFHGEREF